MQDVALTVGLLAEHAFTVHGNSRVRSRMSDGTMRSVTFAAVGRRSAQLAHALRATAGINGDERVGTFMWNNQEHVEAYCAVPAMGAVLHTLNIRLTAEQIAYVANHAEDQVVVVDGSLVEVFAPVVPQLSTVHTLIVTGQPDLSPLEGHGRRVERYDEFIAGQPETFPWATVDERSAAAMCYTSGTTGNPKGVAYSHRSTFLHATAVCAPGVFDIGPHDTVLAVVPMFHANAWGFIYAALLAGADLLLPDQFLQAQPLVELIQRERPTVSGGVPTVWNDVLRYLEAHPEADVSSLRLVACGGSAVSRELLEGFERDHGICMVQAWGMTETSPLAAIARPAAGDPDHWDMRVTQGTPLWGIEARIVDDNGNSVPHDGASVGELQVRGPWVTGSYYGSDDGASFHDGWLATGDVGTINGRGYISLTDRAKDLIKSGGEWISSVELELAIAAHPAVLEAAVIAIPDDRWQERPLAAVVMKPTMSVSTDELRDFLSDKVAKWWIPESWSFIDQVPRTSVGKFDKKLLRANFAKGDLTIASV
ncbi:fatty acid--CoA ligase [Mycolicibacterium novocastrense]|uniref:fatty acid--CoA ligase n=1 Tax=Mycolicibacterium novocastrense TaxID=59813 RepID=UPI00157B86E1|nr:fatty acid--CoA ligase [Mycolicibacterium novocastrense]